MELLKQGDFVIVYDPTYCQLVKGIVVYDEMTGSQICISVLRAGAIQQSYYDKKNVVKVC